MAAARHRRARGAHLVAPPALGPPLATGSRTRKKTPPRSDQESGHKHGRHGQQQRRQHHQQAHPHATQHRDTPGGGRANKPRSAESLGGSGEPERPRGRRPRPLWLPDPSPQAPSRHRRTPGSVRENPLAGGSSNDAGAKDSRQTHASRIARARRERGHRRTSPLVSGAPAEEERPYRSMTAKS